MNEKVDKILNEISSVIKKVNPKQIEVLISEISSANKIVVCGAGRVGMAIRGFGMRLGHMGLNAYTIGDSTVPSIGKGDLFIVASGSGETQTIYELTKIAKKNNATVFAITGNPKSRIGELSDSMIQLEAPSKTKKIDNLISIQPMTTLNEQCLGILFDWIVLEAMNKFNESHDTMWSRHSNLE